jgi:hypothetical protein
MMTFKFRNATAALVSGLAAAAIATAAPAKSPAADPGHAAPTSEVLIDGIVRMSPDSAKALRECNGLAASFRDYSWGITQSDIYRSCEARHGQSE